MKPADGYLNASECLFSTPCHHGVLRWDPAIGPLGTPSSVAVPGFTSGPHLPFRGIIDGSSTYPTEIRRWRRGFIVFHLRGICCAHHLHLARQVSRYRPCRLPGPSVISAVPLVKVATVFPTDALCVLMRACLSARRSQLARVAMVTHTGFTKSVGA